MVVMPVDDHDLCIGVPQCFSGFEAAKTCPDDHYLDFIVRHWISPYGRKSQPASLVAKFATTL
jgi:hypothetical protein